MIRNRRLLKKIVPGLILLAALVAIPVIGLAHCDSVDGPVAIDARKALESGDFQAIAKWVGMDQQSELQNRFEESRAVYEEGGRAKELAERYFVETAVRLHRQAEGFPYTGLKPAGPLPRDIAVAEKTLQTGEVQPIVDLLSRELQQEIAKWHDKAVQARQYRDKSLQQGQEWVDAYVKYVIYVHGLHQAIQAGPKHGVGD